MLNLIGIISFVIAQSLLVNCAITNRCNGNACDSVRTKICRSNLVFNGTDCVGISAIQCPLGYYWNGRSCAYQAADNIEQEEECATLELNITATKPYTIAPTIPEPSQQVRSCEAGFEWTGYECSRTLKSEPYCGENYHLFDGFCQRFINGICPLNFQLINAQCVYKIESAVECEYGFEWNGEFCSNKIPVTCPKDYEFINGVCERLITGHCPSGLQLIGNDRCIGQELQNVQCPPDYTLNGNECVHNVQSCQSGFKYENGLCIRTVLRPAIYTCPNGTDLRESDSLCISSNRSCPNSYYLKNNICVLKCKPKPVCPEGFQWINEKCIRTDIKCPIGYEFINDKCELVIPDIPGGGGGGGNEVIKPFCPVGYQYKDGWCIRGDENDNIIKPTCPNGYYFEHNKCIKKVTPECPSGYDHRNNMCYPVSIPDRPIFPECPDGFVLYYGDCVASQNVICPNGYEFRDYNCVLSDSNSTAIRPICPDNTYFDQDRFACISFGVATSTTESYWIKEKPTYVPPPDKPFTPPNGGGCTNNGGGSGSNNGGCGSNNGNCGSNNGNCGSNNGNCGSNNGGCGSNNGGSGSNNGGCGSNANGQGCVINIENIINNNNTVNHPINISPVNHNHIYLHLNSDGSGKEYVKVLNNNDTNQIYIDRPDNTHGSDITDEIISDSDSNNNVDDDKNSNNAHSADRDTADQNESNQKCCEVITPRQCKRRDNDWHCFHRKYHRCGDFCVQPKIYLRPRTVRYNSPILIMPPPPSWFYNFMSYTSNGLGHVDCSGCIGGGYRCSNECFTYNCTVEQHCGYVDQKSFCETNGGTGCQLEDGWN